jgi:hypothetical protein
MNMMRQTVDSPDRGAENELISFANSCNKRSQILKEYVILILLTLLEVGFIYLFV